MADLGKLGQIANSHSMAFDPKYLLNQHSEEIPNHTNKDYRLSGLYYIVIEGDEVKVIDNSKTR